MTERRVRSTQTSERRRSSDRVDIEGQPIVAKSGLDLPLLSWGLVWKTLVIIGALIGSIWGGGVWWAEHTQVDIDRDKKVEMQATLIRRQAEQIRVLQEIQYAEHPAYWRNILESQKER